MKYSRLSAIVWVLFVVASTACNDAAAPGPTADSLVADQMASDFSVSDPTVLPVADEKSINVGDVEQALRVIGVLSGLSTSENIVEETLVDGRDRVRAVNIQVNPPNPDSLWIAVRVSCSREFIERPVVLDTRVLVDGELMDSFTIVLSEQANKNSFHRDVEVLFGQDEIPETMLVTMESEALLLPEGTDLSVTDPYTVTEGDRTKAIAHTPVRIDFTAPGPKPAKADADTAPAASAEPDHTEPS